jgi:hypothetical protein
MPLPLVPLLLAGGGILAKDFLEDVVFESALPDELNLESKLAEEGITDPSTVGIFGATVGAKSPKRVIKAANALRRMIRDGEEVTIDKVRRIAKNFKIESSLPNLIKFVDAKKSQREAIDVLRSTAKNTGGDAFKALGKSKKFRPVAKEIQGIADEALTQAALDKVVKTDLAIQAGHELGREFDEGIPKRALLEYNPDRPNNRLKKRVKGEKVKKEKFKKAPPKPPKPPTDLEILGDIDFKEGNRVKPSDDVVKNLAKNLGLEESEVLKHLDKDPTKLERLKKIGGGIFAKSKDGTKSTAKSASKLIPKTKKGKLLGLGGLAAAGLALKGMFSGDEEKPEGFLTEEILQDIDTAKTGRTSRERSTIPDSADLIEKRLENEPRIRKSEEDIILSKLPSDMSPEERKEASRIIRRMLK